MKNPSRRLFRTTLLLALVIALSELAPVARAESAPHSLWKFREQLKASKWVDLTHPFDGTIPHWKGFQPMTTKVLYEHEKHGFKVEEFCHVGQWGTHVDPPVHFHKDLKTAEDIPLEEMFLPLVVFDVHEKVAKDPDYVLSLEDVKHWEKKHGPVPSGSFAAMRSDWSKRWPSQEKMQNLDKKGVAHYPGWSLEALKYLYEERRIAASGHEPTDTDPGVATSQNDYSLESYILKQNHYQIELLTNLDQVPEAGALAVVTWPKIKSGSGFPARVFAIVP